MANPEHVKIVKQGAKAIEEWRKRNPGVRLDLRRADLRRADLSEAHLLDADLTGADLRKANLIVADLRRADLTGADLRGADLTEANLRGANLSGVNLRQSNLRGANLLADLRGAYLTGADFRGANLTGADLRRANLTEANLRKADLTQATIAFTTFVRCNLSEAKGLESVGHAGPSTISIDTIIMSGGKIPRAFLEGAGVPDTWIEYIPSLVGTPLEFYSAFLAHSHKDQEFADRLYASLKEKGARVWYFPSDARGGRRVKGEIYSAIQYYDKVMVVCSKDSLSSPAVRDEIDQAVQKQEESPDRWTLLPIAIDDAVYNEKSEFARRLRLYVIEDFRGWRKPEQYQAALEKLLKDLATKERPR